MRVNRFEVEKKELKELEAKIEEFLKERGRVQEVLFNELEGAIRKGGYKDLDISKLLGLFSYEIGTWKFSLKKFGVPEKQILDILSAAIQSFEKAEERKEEENG